jgi:single-strand DNA-binding protein
MKSLNKHQILGHVGKDPEVKTTSGGKTVAKFSVATNYRAKNASGDYEDQTDWHNIVAFERTAEIVRDYISKGSQVYIEGRSQTRSYEKDGQTKYFTEILANELILCGGGGDRTKPSKPEAGNKKPDAFAITDDDIPF